MQCLLSFPLQIALGRPHNLSMLKFIMLNSSNMLAQTLVALMARGNNPAMCPRRNRAGVPLMGTTFLIRAQGSLVQVSKNRGGTFIRNRFLNPARSRRARMLCGLSAQDRENGDVGTVKPPSLA
jgi:hypothetical protein